MTCTYSPPRRRNDIQISARCIGAVTQCIHTPDNATVSDLIGLTFWKYIEESGGLVEFVSYATSFP